MPHSTRSNDNGRKTHREQPRKKVAWLKNLKFSTVGVFAFNKMFYVGMCYVADMQGMCYVAAMRGDVIVTKRATKRNRSSQQHVTTTWLFLEPRMLIFSEHSRGLFATVNICCSDAADYNLYQQALAGLRYA